MDFWTPDLLGAQFCRARRVVLSQKIWIPVFCLAQVRRCSKVARRSVSNPAPKTPVMGFPDDDILYGSVARRNKLSTRSCSEQNSTVFSRLLSSKLAPKLTPTCPAQLTFPALVFPFDLVFSSAIKLLITVCTYAEATFCRVFACLRIRLNTYKVSLTCGERLVPHLILQQLLVRFLHWGGWERFGKFGVWMKS